MTTVDYKTLNYVLSDDLNYEIKEFLNSVIDEELEKGDETDTDLIDECVDILLDLESENIDEAQDKLKSSSKIIKFCHKKTARNKTAKRASAAAIALLIAAGTATYSTKPAVARQMSGFFENIVGELFDFSSSTEKKELDVSSIELSFPNGGPEFDRDSEKPDLSKMKVTAIYSDGTEGEIPLDKCKISGKMVSVNNEEKYVVSVSYGGCSGSIAFDAKERK